MQGGLRACEPRPVTCGSAMGCWINSFDPPCVPREVGLTRHRRFIRVVLLVSGNGKAPDVDHRTTLAIASLAAGLLLLTSCAGSPLASE